MTVDRRSAGGLAGRVGDPGTGSAVSVPFDGAVAIAQRHGRTGRGLSTPRALRALADLPSEVAQLSDPLDVDVDIEDGGDKASVDVLT